MKKTKTKYQLYKEFKSALARWDRNTRGRPPQYVIKPFRQIFQKIGIYEARYKIDMIQQQLKPKTYLQPRRNPLMFPLPKDISLQYYKTLQKKYFPRSQKCDYYNQKTIPRHYETDNGKTGWYRVVTRFIYTKIGVSRSGWIIYSTPDAPDTLKKTKINLPKNWVIDADAMTYLKIVDTAAPELCQYHFRLSEIIRIHNSTNTIHIVETALNNLIQSAQAAFTLRKNEVICDTIINTPAALQRVWVCFQDSIDAGNCPQGSRQFQQEHHLQRVGAVRADVLLSLKNDHYTRRAISAAITNRYQNIL